MTDTVTEFEDFDIAVEVDTTVKQLRREPVPTWPSRIVAAADALGAHPREIKSVHRRGRRVHVTHGDGTEYVIVDPRHPDAAGRSGVLLGRPFGGTTAMPLYAPNRRLLARLRARRTTKRRTP